MHRDMSVRRERDAWSRAFRMGLLVVVGAAWGVACGSSGVAEPTGYPSDARITPLTIVGALSLTAAASIDQQPTPTSTAGQLRAVVTFANTGDTPVQLSYGDCWASIQAFSPSMSTAGPVFESLGAGDCQLWAHQETVAAHAVTTATHGVDLDFLHNHGVPAGTYLVRLSVKTNGELRRFDLGAVAIP